MRLSGYIHRQKFWSRPVPPAIGSQPSGTSPGSEEHDLEGYARLVERLDIVDRLNRTVGAVGPKKWSIQLATPQFATNSFYLSY